MLKKELVKEKWISFENKSNLEEDIPNIELARIVYNTMKNCIMYNKKPNKELKNRYDNLNTFVREIKDVKSVSIIRKANINNKNNLNNNYLIIEDKYGPNVVLDIDNGIDESYRFRHLFLSNKSKVEELYYDIGKSSSMELAKISKVIYYPKATLINDLTKTKVLKGYILEITDVLNHTLYIDCYNKNLFYNRNNYSLIDNYKRIEVFNEGIINTIPKNLLDIRYNLINLITEVEE